MQILRQDIWSIDKEVWAHEGRSKATELGQVVDELLLAVSPSEVCVTLMEANFTQSPHHRGPGKCFGKEDDIRVSGVDIGDKPFPKRHWLGVWVIYSKDSDTQIHPKSHNP